MQSLLDLPSCLYRPLHMLSNGLWNFKLVLLGNFDESVEFAEVNTWFDGIFYSAYPALKFLFFGGAQAIEVSGDAPGHFWVGECEWGVRAKAVVGEVIGEDEVELGASVVVGVVVQQLHRLRACAVPRDDACISQEGKKEMRSASCEREYPVRNSQAPFPRNSSPQSWGTPPGHPPGRDCGGRLQDCAVGAGLGALYNKSGTVGEVLGGSLSNRNLMIFEANGHCFVDHTGHEGFLVLILRLLKAALSVLS